jgi:hypothetical protein
MVDKIKLHPQAQDWLFRYYRALRYIFNDVLGHLELDYISMALLNPQQELVFFSSQPSIEHNLIEHQLWQFDPCIQTAYLAPQESLIWPEIYQAPSFEQLKHYKLIKPKLEFVLSKAVATDNYAISYAFGVKSKDPEVHINLVNNTKTLLSIGKFCLHNILQELELNLLPPSYFKTNPQHLHLVVNSF